MAGTAEARSVFESGFLSNGDALPEDGTGTAPEPCAVEVAFGGVTLFDEAGVTFILLSAAERTF